MSLALLADTPCSDCGALLEEGQRYCVHCGRRRSEVDDPAVAWLTRNKADSGTVVAAAAAPVPPSRNPYAIPALSLLLLPIAVAIGALAGHHSDGGKQQEQLLQALRSQKAPVVNVSGGGAGVASTATADAAKKAKLHAAKGKVGKRDSSGGKVVARTRYGVAHEIQGFKPTAAKINSDKKLVEHINKAIGKNYLQAQKNLPDTIVVPTGTGGGGSTQAQGRGD